MKIYEPGQSFVYDGPMETRIEYQTNLKLDKEMSIFALCDSPEGRQALGDFYRRDIEAARRWSVPIVLNAPSYRASSAHAERMGYTAPDAIRTINRQCLELVREIRGEFADFQEKIFLTAPVGPKHAGCRGPSRRREPLWPCARLDCPTRWGSSSIAKPICSTALLPRS
jgi:hypothetical protein